MPLRDQYSLLKLQGFAFYMDPRYLAWSPPVVSYIGTIGSEAVH